MGLIRDACAPGEEVRSLSGGQGGIAYRPSENVGKPSFPRAALVPVCTSELAKATAATMPQAWQYTTMTASDAQQPPTGRALGAALRELSKTLRSDVESVVRPLADADGNILHRDQLLASASRVSRIAARIASLSQPNGAISPAANSDLAELYVLSDSFVFAMKPVVEVAEMLPRTTEEFYMPLGPAIPGIERGATAIVSKIDQLNKHIE